MMFKIIICFAFCDWRVTVVVVSRLFHIFKFENWTNQKSLENTSLARKSYRICHTRWNFDCTINLCFRLTPFESHNTANKQRKNNHQKQNVLWKMNFLFSFFFLHLKKSILNELHKFGDQKSFWRQILIYTIQYLLCLLICRMKATRSLFAWRGKIEKSASKSLQVQQIGAKSN